MVLLVVEWSLRERENFRKLLTSFRASIQAVHVLSNKFDDYESAADLNDASKDTQGS